VDHYLDLATAGLASSASPGKGEGSTLESVLSEHTLHPTLTLSKSDPDEPYAVLHPGTARWEKFWLVERWVEVARHLIETHNFRIVITTNRDELEFAHASEIQSAIGNPRSAIETPADLCVFASILANARLVISVDTAAVHLAAAFQRPQIALFGPTNPFHWRPRHDRAAVISAAQPGAPMSNFTPRMKGAAMEYIPASTVVGAADGLLRAGM
jgi:ADP-heptose:LPS heptosyltransferase